MRKLVLFILFTGLMGNGILMGQTEKKQITLEDIWTYYKFYPRMVRGMEPLADGNRFAVIKKGNVVVYDYKTGDSVTTLIYGKDLVPEGKEKPVTISGYSVNKDETRFIIPTQTESIYRHSTISYNYIWDKNEKKLTPLSENGKQRLADFSPGGNMVAFVRDNNIFIKDLNKGEEKQITFDGKKNAIINGTCDWVYEEEFSFTKAFFWSPDGKKIAFYRFDESKVKEYSLTYYGKLYPEHYKYKYPKAGEDNSVVEIYVYDLETGKTVKMDTGEETDQYIPRIKWTQDANTLAIERLNRLQNHLDILLADATTGKSRILYTEDNPWYIEITDDLTFLPDNKHFIITSEKDGYNHIYLYDLKGNMVRRLTKGNWDVTKVYGYDAKRKRIFYQSAESSPLNRDIYVVNLKGKRKKISQRTGTNNAAFNSTFTYYVNTFTDANTPPVITVNNAAGKELRVLEDNAVFVKLMNEYDLSKKEFFTLKSSRFVLPDSTEVSLNGWMIKPPHFDPDKRYPLLMYVYGGPGSQTVQNSWGWSNYFWFQMLAEKGIVVVSVDNRGTGARGQVFKKMTYLQLGKYEIADQIEAARILGEYDYIDSSRIAMFGWSYGGFMSTLAITKGADRFSTAVAVAPVTNWRYYDNIYTERYMRKPQDNPNGYDDNSPINFTDKIKGNYLLCFGSADDNVHPQNSMDLITALVKSNKQFDMMVYPNKNHGIYGGNTRYHLYKKMTDFLLKHLTETE